MGANATWFDERYFRFHDGDGHDMVGPADLGEDLASALMSGSEMTVFGKFATYAVEMLRITGRTGRFCDFLYNTDHKYDPKTPTVGHKWSNLRGKPLRKCFSLPKLTCQSPRLGADAIWYTPETGLFHFGGYALSPRKIGRLLALSLMRGEELVEVGEITVTVNYLVEMLRLTGRKGQFIDIIDDDCAFDRNCPSCELSGFVKHQRLV